MINRNLLTSLENSFSKLTIARVHHEAAKVIFQKEHHKIQDLIRNGESTGDVILDWALFSGEYPYQKREKSARVVYNYLQEHIGDYFFFLNKDHDNHYLLHLGKLKLPILSFENGQLRLVAEQVVQKDVSFYDDSSYVRNVSPERDAYIAGLIIEPYQQENSFFESTYTPFSMDDHHYILGAGERTVLTYLHGENILPEPTKEQLEKLLSK